MPSDDVESRYFNHLIRSIFYYLYLLFSILCDLTSNNSSGGFVFHVRAHYPSKYACRTLVCVQKYFTNIRNKFLQLTRIILTASDGTKVNLGVCSVDDSGKYLFVVIISNPNVYSYQIFLKDHYN